ncbi:MAG TPA: Glu/Leu/Phe/Val dehydrogenase [Hellea balneolensis]|uniref:Glu/Leu/Phe/Val dehydrogenase n=1 Tax=Hellea balneolensis TaxID=287478 RepID=A0A7C5QXC2_9PROT|nr:Glu/Leu/Phe/Val dehydrogenase [Hellea balneolensis]
MSVFENTAYDAHEAVHAFYDDKSGLKGFIAVHSTHCGPSAGGVRFWRYDNSTEALTDVLRLSRGMSFKNAMAGLNLGGGKAVVMIPEGGYDRAALFRAFGRFLNRTGGHYYTAEDVGMTPADMREIKKETDFVAGLDEGEAASGDPSPVTADGVFRCIKLGAKRKFGQPLNGMTVAIQGLGHVGMGVCEHLHDAGARLIATDINPDAVSEVQSRFGAVIVAPDDIYGVKADVFSPCALGATLNEVTIPTLKAKVIAGAANNQLSTPAMGQALVDRGILYCPDYVVNAGGIINVAGEIEGHYSKAWVEDKLEGIVKTLSQIIDLAEASGRPTSDIADEMAMRRIGR